MNDDNDYYDGLEAWQALLETVDPLAKKDRFKEGAEASQAIPLKPESGSGLTESKDDRSVSPKPPSGRRSFPRPSKISDKMRRQIRRGRVSIEVTVDLHHLSRNQALVRLTRTIRQSRQAGQRVMLVITGKGNPDVGTGVIRRELPHWLERKDIRDAVYAFGPAERRHGGRGAFYLFLRRIKHDE